MEVVDAAIVMLPRFTTLLGTTPNTAYVDFTTLPLDVSRFTGAQFQFWRGPGGGVLSVFLEESLDSQTWAMGASAPTEFVIPASDTSFFSYNFLLRWFRLRVRVSGGGTTTFPVITCWAEGLLRGGGAGGAWGIPQSPTGGTATAAAGDLSAVTPPQTESETIRMLLDDHSMGRGRKSPDEMMAEILKAAGK